MVTAPRMHAAAAGMTRDGSGTAAELAKPQAVRLTLVPVVGVNSDAASDVLVVLVDEALEPVVLFVADFDPW